MNVHITIMAGLFWAAIQLIGRTIRFEFSGRKLLDAAGAERPSLFAVWHQATFVMFFLYRHRNACVLVTAEPRGQVLGACARWLGYQVITVPDRKNSLEYARSLARMLQTLRHGRDAVIAVDGPSGPLFEVKPGAYYLAGKANVPIVPVGIKAPWKLTLAWRWDKYFVPLPFSRVKVGVGRPIGPDEQLKVDLKQRLGELS